MKTEVLLHWLKAVYFSCSVFGLAVYIWLFYQVARLADIDYWIWPAGVLVVSSVAQVVLRLNYRHLDNLLRRIDEDD